MRGQNSAIHIKYTMKTYRFNRFTALVLSVLGLFATGCSKNKIQGELVGAPGEKWYAEKPYGMELIPSGSFVMGKTEEDLALDINAPAKTVSVGSFYMDATEITNAEYRQFVYWVRDSIARTKLAVLADELGLTPEDGGIGAFAFKEADTTDMTPYQKYRYFNKLGSSDNYYEGYTLNQDVELIWDTSKYPDEYYAEVMDQLYLSEEESFNGRRTLRVNQLQYQYNYLDVAAAARDRSDDRKKYIIKENIKVYPDTTVWMNDFSYTYVEPMHNDYFWHDAYSEYPVVGVTWKQAMAFCHWRTKIKNDALKAQGKRSVNAYRLPTEAEWEYAARGGIQSGTYPWGGPYLVGDDGCFLANFKPQRGDYATDSALYTVEAKSYTPNDYNLYNMAGNVAEWTISSYSDSAYEYVSTINPFSDDRSNPNKVVRGGSWKDVAYFLQVSTRDYEHMDKPRSYIGFRTVQDYMGETGEKDRRKQ
jgi:sulfatase modifying factor 1